MKKAYAYLVAMSCLSLAGYSQEYTSSVWTIYDNATTTGIYHYSQVSYAKDTAVDGLTWQKFDKITKQISYYPQPDTVYIAYDTLYTTLLRLFENGVVKYKSEEDSVIYTYADFNAQVGSSWVYAPAKCGNNGVFTVDSIGTEIIGGISTRWIRGHEIDTFYEMPTKRIYENLGGLNEDFFKPSYLGNCLQFSDSRYYQLSCYTSSLRNEVVYDSLNCALYYQLHLETEGKPQLYISPNQVIEAFTINGEVADYTVKVVDLHGKVWIDSITQDNTVAVDFLPPGIYFVRVYLGENEVLRTKVLK